MAVTKWPSYLITRIPDDLRSALEEDAEESGTSLAEIMRRILCAHYGLDCEQVERFGGPAIEGSDRFVLRLQPDLFSAIKKDSAKSGETMRTLLLEILSSHYNGVT